MPLDEGMVVTLVAAVLGADKVVSSARAQTPHTAANVITSNVFFMVVVSLLVRWSGGN
jgi:hypothetical protein